MFNFVNPRFPSFPVGILVVLGLIDVILKGFAIWKAIKNNQMYWFVALFVLNTAGILPLAYLVFFQPESQVLKLIKPEVKSSKRKTSKRK
ncbi:DUF5652 family protein [Candidatus Microgenomates bacterium]|nr:DUF5652 family protein [Candidatus Microgenomates bacterium]